MDAKDPSSVCRVLVVDDSATARAALKRAIEDSRAGFRIVGEATNGAQALRATTDLKPDIITMDVYLGSDDGVEVAETIMTVAPTPILVMAGRPDEPGLAFRALQAGALDVTGKPPGPQSRDYDKARRKLWRTLRALSTVPLVRRRVVRTQRPFQGLRRFADGGGSRRSLVAIGASTGGPAVLSQLLAQLEAPCPAPIVIVQHMSEGFAAGLAKWLDETTGHRVLLCDDAMPIESSTVFIAPDDRHLILREGTTLVPIEGPPRRYQRPSIDEFLESVASAADLDTLGVLLTGMGDDGARGLLSMRRAGAMTVAQESSTCVVPSMPASAVAIGAVERVLSPEDIGKAIHQFGGFYAETSPS